MISDARKEERERGKERDVEEGVGIQRLATLDDIPTLLIEPVQINTIDI